MSFLFYFKLRNDSSSGSWVILAFFIFKCGSVSRSLKILNRLPIVILTLVLLALTLTYIVFVASSEVAIIIYGNVILSPTLEIFRR